MMTGAVDFTQGLFGKLRDTSGPVWENYVDHPFVRGVGSGNLPKSAFRRFLTQDYLFLKHFSRAYGLSVAKSTTVADIRACAAGLQGILDELPLHVGYCAGWGISEEEMEAEEEAAETMTYTRFVMDTGMHGDLLDLLTALMPCVAGYAEVGARLLAMPEASSTANPYATWIANYDSPEYKASVQLALEKFDSVGQRYGAETRLPQLQKIFDTATRLESDFWQMGLNEAGQAEAA